MGVNQPVKATLRWESDVGVHLPQRATPCSAGYDFFAPHDFDVEPGKVTNIDLGVRIAGEMGPWVLLMFPRSSYGMKYGLRFTNTTGVIDSDYRDNIHASLRCDFPISVKKGDRIAQGVLVPFLIMENDIMPTIERKGGMGSTGR